jgi:threonyl-tRNA synthetase
MELGDHRSIGNRLELFHQQDQAAGMVFWHPRGAVLYRALEDYIFRLMRGTGFREVRTPQLMARSLWEESGHLEKFGEGMFTLGEGERALALKPMSCPGHVQVFKKRVRSYRELPVRYCEFGVCHRNEPSGSLHGLMRTRAFVQDDAHIFCRQDQVEEEVGRFCRLLRVAYARLGFADFAVRFATRPDVRAGSDQGWDRAESLLSSAARAAGLSHVEHPGEGAFYGPKLEFVLRDAQGRDWQCGTIQLDLVLPERLDAEYVDAHGQRVRPIMIHHAVLGSLERFVAILLEHYRGRLPLWLAPDQVAVAPVSDEYVAYAQRVVEALEDADLRVVLDNGADTLSRRVVEAFERGIPALIVVGKREAAQQTVSLRRDRDQVSVLPLIEAVDALSREAHGR